VTCHERGSEMTEEQTQPKRKVRWIIDMTDSVFVFSREINGQIDESYRAVSADRAAIDAVAIINGYEPVRRLYPQE